MKTIILASAAVLSLGIGAAYAGDGSGQSTETLFTQLRGEEPVVASRAPSAYAIQNGAQAQAQIFVTSHNAGTWLFPPNQNGGGQN